MKKSKNTVLSLEQRCNICLMSEKHPKWKQSDLAKWAYDTFKLPKIPSQGTISRVLSKKEIYINLHFDNSNSLRLNKKKILLLSKINSTGNNSINSSNNSLLLNNNNNNNQNDFLIELVLKNYIIQNIWNNIPITNLILQNTANSIWNKTLLKLTNLSINNSNFNRSNFNSNYNNGSFSNRWINNFLSNLNLNLSFPNKHPKIWNFDDRYILKDLLARINRNDLFTLDETFLAYNLPLDYDQYEKNYIQRKIDVITIMLCCNVTGTEKSSPLVIGKYNNYKSFKNFFPKNYNSKISLGENLASRFNINYKSNRKSWLTSTIFHDWLITWDNKLKNQENNRKIWIILDDSNPHRIININLSNINLVYTSSKSNFLPFNWGLLDDFKTNYRIQQYKALIELQNRLKKKLNSQTNFLISFEQSQLTMANAFKFIQMAWNSIPSNRIKASWKSASILPASFFDDSDLTTVNNLAFKKKNYLLQNLLNIECDTYYVLKKWDYDLLLDLNIENKNSNTNFLSIDELIDSSIIENYEPGFNDQQNQINSTDNNNNTTNQLDNSSSMNNTNPQNINNSNNTIGTTTSIENLNEKLNNSLQPGTFPYQELNTTTTNDNNLGSVVDPNNPIINNTVDLVNTETTFDTSKAISNINLQAASFPIPNFDNLLDTNFDNDKLFTVSALIDGPLNSTNDDFITNDNNNINFTLPTNDFLTNFQNNNNDLASVNNDTSSMAKSNSNNSNIIQKLPSNDTSIDVSPMSGNNGTTINNTEINNNNDNDNINSMNNSFLPNLNNLTIPELDQILQTSDFAPLNDNTNNMTTSVPTLNNYNINTNGNIALNNASSLGYQITLANTLGSVIHHASINDITLTDFTVNELRTQYVNVLQRIEKTKQQFNNQKVRRGQVYLESLLSNATNEAWMNNDNLLPFKSTPSNTDIGNPMHFNSKPTIDGELAFDGKPIVDNTTMNFQPKTENGENIGLTFVDKSLVEENLLSNDNINKSTL